MAIEPPLRSKSNMLSIMAISNKEEGEEQKVVEEVVMEFEERKRI